MQSRQSWKHSSKISSRSANSAFSPIWAVFDRRNLAVWAITRQKCQQFWQYRQSGNFLLSRHWYCLFGQFWQNMRISAKLRNNGNFGKLGSLCIFAKSAKSVFEKLAVRAITEMPAVLAISAILAISVL